MAKEETLVSVFGNKDPVARDMANNFDASRSKEGVQRVVAAMSVHGASPKLKLGNMQNTSKSAAIKVARAGNDPEPE